MQVVYDLVDKMAESVDAEIITVISGEDASKKDDEALKEYISTHHSDLEVDMIDGGQPVYSYLIGIE